MPADLEITYIYPTLDAVYAGGKCIGVVIPAFVGIGVVFFHYDSATMTRGADAESAVEAYFLKED
ncbi:MAG: hypothetical protein IJO56_05780 [Oscillospiraceae bacterium]|nr:hypothetical protein [Oscillospiraceae bacterium]